MEEYEREEQGMTPEEMKQIAEYMNEKSSGKVDFRTI